MRLSEAELAAVNGMTNEELERERAAGEQAIELIVYEVKNIVVEVHVEGIIIILIIIITIIKVWAVFSATIIVCFLLRLMFLPMSHSQ